MSDKGVTEMDRKISMVRNLVRLVALVTSLIVPSLAFAQNCALCYTQAAASGSRMIQALRSGIAILVIPPMAICIIITIMAYRKNNHFDDKVSCESAERNASLD
jgi:hypothetical protein